MTIYLSLAIVAAAYWRFRSVPLDRDYAPYAYDAVGGMIAAMKAADSAEPAKYLPELAKIHYAGVTFSDITFDGNGDLKGAQVTVYQWKKGERVPQ